MAAQILYNPTVLDFKTAGYVLDATKTVRGVKDVYFGTYRYPQINTDTIFEQNSFVGIIQMLKEVQNQLEFVCLSDVPFDAETYRHARLYFDILKEAREISRSMKTEAINCPTIPIHYHSLLKAAVQLFNAIELCAAHLEERFNTLDASITEKSRYLTHISGEELWSIRNKNYAYLV